MLQSFWGFLAKNKSFSNSGSFSLAFKVFLCFVFLAVISSCKGSKKSSEETSDETTQEDQEQTEESLEHEEQKEQGSFYSKTHKTQSDLSEDSKVDVDHSASQISSSMVDGKVYDDISKAIQKITSSEDNLTWEQFQKKLAGFEIGKEFDDEQFCLEVTSSFKNQLFKNIFFDRNEFRLNNNGPKILLHKSMQKLNDDFRIFTLDDLNEADESFGKKLFYSIANNKCDVLQDISKYFYTKLSYVYYYIEKPLMDEIKSLPKEELIAILDKLVLQRSEVVVHKDNRELVYATKQDILFVLKRYYVSTLKSSLSPLQDALKMTEDFFERFFVDVSNASSAPNKFLLYYVIPSFVEIVFANHVLDPHIYNYVKLGNEFYAPGLVIINNFNHGEIIAKLSNYSGSSLNVGDKIHSFLHPIIKKSESFRSAYYGYFDHFLMASEKSQMKFKKILEEVGNASFKDEVVDITKTNLNEIPSAGYSLHSLASPLDDSKQVKVGYIVIDRFATKTNFQDDSSQYLSQILVEYIEKLKSDGAQALVLDLTNLEIEFLEVDFVEAANVISLFLKEPVEYLLHKKVDYKDVKDYDLEYELIDKTSTRKFGDFSDIPLIVFTSKKTRGAGEFLADSLKTYNRAIVVGASQTSGRLEVLSPYSLDITSINFDKPYSLIPTSVVLTADKTTSFGTGVAADLALDFDFSEYFKAYSDGGFDKFAQKFESNAKDYSASLNFRSEEIVSKLLEKSTERTANDLIIQLLRKEFSKLHDENSKKMELIEYFNFYAKQLTASDYDFDLSVYEPFSGVEEDDFSLHMLKSFFKSYNLRKRIVFSDDFAKSQHYLNTLLNADRALKEAFHIAVDYTLLCKHSTDGDTDQDLSLGCVGVDIGSDVDADVDADVDSGSDIKQDIGADSEEAEAKVEVEEQEVDGASEKTQ